MTWSPTANRKITECTPQDTRGPKRLWSAGPGWVSRHRGDVGRMVRHDYVCPVHGRFELEVRSDDVPDAVLCAVDLEASPMALVERLLTEGADKVESTICRAVSPWSPPAFDIWPSSGEVKS